MGVESKGYWRASLGASPMQGDGKQGVSQSPRSSQSYAYMHEAEKPVSGEYLNSGRETAGVKDLQL